MSYTRILVHFAEQVLTIDELKISPPQIQELDPEPFERLLLLVGYKAD